MAADEIIYWQVTHWSSSFSYRSQPQPNLSLYLVVQVPTWKLDPCAIFPNGNNVYICMCIHIYIYMCVCVRVYVCIIIYTYLFILHISTWKMWCFFGHDHDLFPRLFWGTFNVPKKNGPGHWWAPLQGHSSETADRWFWAKATIAKSATSAWQPWHLSKDHKRPMKPIVSNECLWNMGIWEYGNLATSTSRNVVKCSKM